MKLLPIVALLSSAFASPTKQQYHDMLMSRGQKATQHLLQEDCVPEGMSAQCTADSEVFCNDQEFQQAYLQFVLTNTQACFASSLPTFGDSKFGNVEPCDDGVEEFRPTCEAARGTMCQMTIQQSLTDTNANLSISVIFSQWFCAPASCALADYDVITDPINEAANALGDALPPASGISIDLQLSIFCDAGTGVPTNFGPGVQTEVEFEGETAEDASFILGCDECSPPWSVEIETEAGFDDGQLSNVLAAALNAADEFSDAGCKAQWIESSQTYNIYCPDAGSISMAFELDGSVGAGLLGAELLQQQDATNFDGNGVRSSGEQREFETEVNDGSGGNAASSLSTAVASVVGVMSLLVAALAN